MPQDRVYSVQSEKNWSMPRSDDAEESWGWQTGARHESVQGRKRAWQSTEAADGQDVSNVVSARTPAKRVKPEADRWAATTKAGRRSTLQSLHESFVARLSHLAPDRLEDMLKGSIERWLRNCSKKGSAVGKMVDGLLMDYGALVRVQNSTKVREVLSVFRPPIDSLQDWIGEHMQGEIEVFIEDGQVMLQQPREDLQDPDQLAALERRTLDWIATLPEDCLTEEEMQLRQALINYLDNWKDASSPPALADALDCRSEESVELTLAKLACIPRKIKLYDWIRCRIGKEVEVFESLPGSTKLFRLVDGYHR